MVLTLATCFVFPALTFLYGAGFKPFLVWQRDCSIQDCEICGGQQGEPSRRRDYMNPNSIEFIYKAMNAIASGKHTLETEQCLSDAIEEELLLINANLALEGRDALFLFPIHEEAHIAVT
jgi:hypothetical protein